MQARCVSFRFLLTSNVARIFSGASALWYLPTLKLSLKRMSVSFFFIREPGGFFLFLKAVEA